MANLQHLNLLRKGIKAWNEWRSDNYSHGFSPDLRNANLYGVHLEGADFSYTHLEGANLSNAYLEEANLQGACLEKANLNGIHLEGAIFTPHLEDFDSNDWLMSESSAHLEGANLYDAHLEGADLRGTHLEKAILCNAHLSGTDFSMAHLEGANLRGAFFRRVNFRHASLIGTDLRGTNLSQNGIIFEQANLSQAHLEGASFYEKDLKYINFSNAYLADADFNQARLESINFRGAHLERINFYQAYLKNVDFTEAYLERTEFLEAHLKEINFSGANLKKALFSLLASEDMGRLYYHNAHIENVNFSRANLQEANLIRVNLANANLEGAKLEEALFEEGKEIELVLSSPSSRLKAGDKMSLDNAFKESNLSAAKRREDEYQVIIFKLPDNGGVLMRRYYPLDTLIDENIFPHLGALLDAAVKKGYSEIKRYTKDWQPVFREPIGDNSLLDDGETFSNESADDSDDGILNNRIDYLDALENGVRDEKGMSVDADGFFHIENEDADDYDPDENIIYGLDGRVEYDPVDDE